MSGKTTNIDQLCNDIQHEHDEAMKADIKSDIEA